MIYYMNPYSVSGHHDLSKITETLYFIQYLLTSGENLLKKLISSNVSKSIISNLFNKLLTSSIPDIKYPLTSVKKPIYLFIFAYTHCKAVIGEGSLYLL